MVTFSLIILFVKGDYKMHNFLFALMIIVGLLIIISVLMQPSKQQDALSALSGESGSIFDTKKSRGFEAVMQRITAILGGIWFLLALLLIYIK